MNTLENKERKATDILDVEMSGREEERNEHQLFTDIPENIILPISECSYYFNWEASSHVRNTLSTEPSTSPVDFGSILKIGRGRNIGELYASWHLCTQAEKANALNHEDEIISQSFQ